MKKIVSWNSQRNFLSSNNKMTYVTNLLSAFLLITTTASSTVVQAETITPVKNSANVSIVVIGRSGTGVSSSVRELLGPGIKTVESSPTINNSIMIEEYELPIIGLGLDETFLKVIDVNTLVDKKTPEQDANTLSALKSYVSHPLGLNKTLPNFFLVVSKFDDSNLENRESEFAQLIKRVELFQKNVYGGSCCNNTIFLFTRLMSETQQDLQNNPNKRLEVFLSYIHNSTLFPDPIEIVLGDNTAPNISSGYRRLPNQEIYPKNVFDTMIRVAHRLGDNLGEKVITNFRGSSRESSKRIYLRKHPNPVLTQESEFLSLIRDLRYDVNVDRKLNINTLIDNWSGTVRQFCDSFYRLNHAQSVGQAEL